MKRFLCLFVLPVVAGAQIASVDVAAPSLGYVYDEQAKSLCAIDGVPGAASLGNALNLGSSIDWIRVSPDRRYAIAAATGIDGLLVVRLNGSTGVAERSELPMADVAFSPSGEIAALLLGDRIEVWSGIPDQPTRVRSISLANSSQRLESLSISDDGKSVIGLESGTLWRISDNGITEELGRGYKGSTFLRLSQDLIAIDSNRVVLFRKSDPDSMEEIAGALGNAQAMALSSDERTIAVLDDARDVVLINREGRTMARISLDGATADGLWRSQGNAVFQLTRTVAKNIWLLDGDSEIPRMFAAGSGEDR